MSALAPRLRERDLRALRQAALEFEADHAADYEAETSEDLSAQLTDIGDSIS